MSRSRGSALGVRWIVILLLGCQACLLVFSGWRHSPTLNEPSHLVAGISYWQFGTFKFYNVNPPLVKLIAALPVVACDPQTDWARVSTAPSVRNEGQVGQDFLRVNGQQGLWFLTLARWMLVPFVLLGGYVCFHWGRELYGDASGLVALTLWCFSPNVIAWGSTITSDAVAATGGVTAAYCFWRWLKQPKWTWALASGLTLGLAELTKTTWVVLFLLWPILWLVWRISNSPSASRAGWIGESCRLAAILGLGLYVLNLGYGFEGTFTRLGDYEFESHTLSGRERAEAAYPLIGNRFSHSPLESIPVPLPAPYLTGIDDQKQDFEATMPSYLNGEWKDGGWWYYYLVGLLLKEPLGTWALALIVVGLSIWKTRGYSRAWQDELVLLGPAVTVFVFVSSQTGFSRYLRYILPCFPFAFIWLGKVGRAVETRQRTMVFAGGIALVSSVVSSLYAYPHSISYFNLLAGGPMAGHRYLIDGNIDWGQDMWYLKRWYDAHSDARPLVLDLYYKVNADLYGMDVLQGDGLLEDGDELQYAQVWPRWYAISVHRLHDRDGRYRHCLREVHPVATAGYSIYIYQLSLEEAKHVRQTMKRKNPTQNDE